MKKYISTLSASALCCAGFASGLLGIDAFIPSNEYSAYDSTLGIVTAFAGGVGSPNCGGIHVSGKVYSDGKLTPKYTFAGWATSCTSYVRGSGITGDGTEYGASDWTDPSKALGKATASDTADVLVLGDGGSATFSFAGGIGNGAGYDFAVFENSLNDTFLEFAFVSVSSDGVHFVDFPAFYLGASPVGSDSTDGGGVNDSSLCYNLGSKYRIGYGNGYDLQELADVEAYARTHFKNGVALDSSVFSTEYIADFLDNYAYLDLNDVRYVKISDIVGDGGVLDSKGDSVYDAYPTTGTSGFDLTGIGVLNVSTVPEPSEIAAFFGLVALLYTARIRNRR